MNKRGIPQRTPHVVKRARVTTVQFGLLSSNEIERLSTVEVTSVVVHKSGIVNRFGINDNAMGTMHRSMLCATCSCDMQTCPGHMGHIKLVTPVLNIEFIAHIHRVLTCVCYYCSRLLFPCDHPKFANTMNISSKKKRQMEIYSLSQKIRTCGGYDAESSQACCGGAQPTYVKDDLFIRAVFVIDEKDVDRIAAGDMIVPVFTPEKLLQILRHIDDADVVRLGMDPSHSHPSSMVWTNLVVPPVPMRPSRSLETSVAVGGEDDLTIRLRGIVKLNLQYGEFTLEARHIDLTRYICRSTTYADIQSLLSPGTQVPTVDKKIKTAAMVYGDLQRLVAGYQDQSKAVDPSEYGGDRKSIRHRFTSQKAKKGRMRHTIFGKRQNYSSRTVITPCSHMDVDEVGVPTWICMLLTYPETVHRYNVRALTAAVRNGPAVHPGANYVVDAHGKLTNLKIVDRQQIELQFGWVVRRHLRDGDYVLFNRQPSLHKMSLMAHRVRVMPGHSFRLHMAATKPYNADFDGDEMNIQLLLDDLTRAEAMELLLVKHNMVKDAVPLVCFQQNTVAAAYFLSDPATRMSKADAWQLLHQNKYFDMTNLPPARTGPDGAEYLTGVDIFSACLPRDLHVHFNDLVVEHGRLVGGRLTAGALNRGVLYTIWKDNGSDAACEFISGMQLMLENYLDVRGLTVGVDDCYLPIPARVKAQVSTARAYAGDFATHNPTDMGVQAEAKENNICLVLDKARDLVGDYVLESIRQNGTRRNGLLEMVTSGAKGNETNIVQILGMVGQQMNHLSMRMSTTTSHFNHARADHSVAHGMIYRSFFQGLRPEEYFHHLVGSRVGLVDTAVKTSETGYSQRRIVKAMEDLVVDLDKTVRNSKGDIVQYVYGDDGFDSTYVENNVLRLLLCSELDVLTRYRCVPSTTCARMATDTRARWAREVVAYDAIWRAEIRELLRYRRALVAEALCAPYNNLCLCPVAFERLLLRAQAQRVSAETTDLTPLDVRDAMLGFWANLAAQHVIVPCLRVECLFWDWCSTKTLFHEYRLDQRSLRWFMRQVHTIFLTKSITPYESVGVIASQHCAEPLTQMTLNRFHKSGQFSTLVTGVARMKEIINVVKYPKTPCMSIVVREGYVLEDLGSELVQLMVDHVLSSWTTQLPTPEDSVRNASFLQMWKKWEHVRNPKHLVFMVRRSEALASCTTPRQVCAALRRCEWGKKIHDFAAMFAYTDVGAATWWVCLNIDPADTLWTSSCATVTKHTGGAVPSDDMVMMYIYEKITKDCIVKGVRGLEDFYIGTKSITELVNDVPTKVLKNVLFTKGSNLMALLNRAEVVPGLLTTNHLKEIESTLGIDAVCAAIEDEWCTVMTTNNAHVGTRHIRLIAEAMCYRGFVCPMTYQGICRETSSVIKKASFEKAMDSFVWGATQGHKDTLGGCMESVCWNGILRAGTGRVSVFSEPVNVPRYLTTLNERRYASNIVRYTPPNDDAMRPFIQPTVTRAPAKVQVQSVPSIAIDVMFHRRSETFQPTSPFHEVVRQVVAPPFFSGAHGFHPWSP